MKTTRLIPFALAASLLACVSSSNAAVIATDFFNGYGATEVNSSGLSGGTGWTSNWSASDASFAPGTSLSYSATGYNNSANLSGSSNGAFTGTGDTTPSPSTAFRTFNDGAANTIWISSLISVSGSDRSILWLDATSASPNDFVGVIDGQIAMRYNGTTIGTAGLYGNNTNPNGNTTFTSGTALLLAKLEINNSGVNDSLSFWFNPNLSGGEGGLGAATISAPTGLDLFGDEIGGIGVLVAGTTGGSEYIDAIRVGTTFADVTSVPEPSIALLGGFGTLLLLRRRRTV